MPCKPASVVVGDSTLQELANELLAMLASHAAVLPGAGRAREWASAGCINRCALLRQPSTVVSAGARVDAPAGGGVSECASIARPPRSFRCARAGCQRGKWRPQAHASPAAGRAAGAAGCAARLTLT